MKLLFKIFTYFTKYIIAFFFKLFQFKSYSSLFSFLKYILTLKGFLFILSKSLWSFAMFALDVNRKIAIFSKSNPTVLLTLSSVIKYFIHNYNLSRLFVYITVALELLALSALATSVLQISYLSSDNMFRFLGEFYSNLQEYCKLVIGWIISFFKDPVESLKILISETKSFFEEISSSSQPLPETETPEMPANLFLVESNSSPTTAVYSGASSSPSSVQNNLDSEPYSFKEWVAALLISAFLFLIFGAVAQNLGYDIGFPTFEISPMGDSISSAYTSVSNFCSSLFQTVKLYLYPSEAINPLIPEFANTVNNSQAFTVWDRQQFSEVVNNFRANNVVSSSNGSSTPTGSDVGSTPKVPGSPATSILSDTEMGSSTGTVTPGFSFSEHGQYFSPKSNPSLFAEGKISLEPLQILTDNLSADKTPDLIGFSPTPPVSSWHQTREVASTIVVFNIANTTTKVRSQSKKFLSSNKKILNIQVRNFSSVPVKYSENKYPLFPTNMLTGKLMEFSPAEIKQNNRIKDAFLFIKNYNADSSWENVFDVLLTRDLFDVLLTEFWERVMNNLKDSDYVILLIRINNPYSYSTLDSAIRVSKFDQESLLNRISDILDMLSDVYRDDPVWGITLDYMVRENYNGKILKDDFIPKSLKEKINFPDKLLKKSTEKLFKYNIPLNNDYLSWGKVHYDSSEISVILDRVNKDKKYIIQHLEHKTKRTAIEIKIKGETILKFEDYKNNWHSFTRKINSSEFRIQNNQIVFKMSNYKTDTLKPIKADKKLTNKIITLDIETMVVDHEHIPYCICFFNGKEKYSFYLSDYPCYQEMLKAAISSLLKSKYSGYTIYVHNLAKFDGIFLLNPLVELSDSENIKINPIFREGSMINLGINYGPKNKYNLSFHDSFLLARHSLKELSVSFQVEHVKTTFPYKFLNTKYNQSINLNYVGGIPNQSFFKNSEEYLQFTEEYLNKLNSTRVNSKNKKITRNNIYSWSLKEETISYCLNDCVSLYEVMIKFNDFIFNRWKLNLQGRPTVSSLTMAIFRAKYLSNIEKQGIYIPLINGQTYLDIKRSYTGGAVDMYIPSNEQIEGKLVREYDQNSQFPSVMQKGYMMPVITKKNKFIKYFEGDILDFFMKPFGFFNVDINTTRELEHPILQVRHRSVRNEDTRGPVSTLRTISPLGSWSGMYFSEELFNSKKYGYKFKVKSGYKFERFDVFKEFVEDLYEIKSAHTPGHPWYTISKLLLNSLYGRFGMNPNFETTSIIKTLEYSDYVEKFEVLDYKFMEAGRMLITFKNNRSAKEAGESRERAKNVSVPIASAITAYARVAMTYFKNNPSFRLLYSDTDSAFIDGELDPKMVGTELGQFKLVNTYKQFAALAPKVYGGITDSGQEVVKVKGLKTKISFEDLKSLLAKDSSLEVSQEKWFRRIDKNSITVRDQFYTLAITHNKRELIFENDRLVGTKPFVLDENSEQEDQSDK